MTNRRRTTLRLVTALAALGLGSVASMAQTTGTSSMFDGQYAGESALESSRSRVLGCSNGGAGTKTIVAGKVSVKFYNLRGK
jgi:hypothetical protein